jgi:hypothetical protein
MRPEILLGVVVANEVWKHNGSAGATITSCIDGKHKRASKHYTGCAVDLRIWNIVDVEKAAMELRQALTDDYDVVVESDHIHLEYDPKEPF